MRLVELRVHKEAASNGHTLWREESEVALNGGGRREAQWVLDVFV